MRLGWLALLASLADVGVLLHAPGWVSASGLSIDNGVMNDRVRVRGRLRERVRNG